MPQNLKTEELSCDVKCPLHCSLLSKGLQLYPDMEITRDIVEFADNIRYKLLKNDQLVTLKEFCFSKIYQFNLNVRLLPKGLWEQFNEKYVFEKVSWNYLEFAIPRFLSKHFGGRLVYNKKLCSQ